MMKRIVVFVFAALAGVTMFAGCSKIDDSLIAPNAPGTYLQITHSEAKEIMDSGTECVILDVRTQEEFDEGHIKGAILLPDYEIETRAESVLTDKSQLILVYCRSGRRSKNAASELAALGYSNVKEFGGIIDWPYETIVD